MGSFDNVFVPVDLKENTVVCSPKCGPIPSFHQMFVLLFGFLNKVPLKGREDDKSKPVVVEFNFFAEV